MKRVCIFCGSNPGKNPAFAEAASAIGQRVAQRGLGLVYGGGNVGLMGIVADAALKAGGEVLGVIPQSLVDKELAHRALTELHIVRSMHERKALMAELSDAFIALPGGYGTLEEFCEILTWTQLGLHQKPSALLNTHGFYNAFIAQIEHATAWGFIPPSHHKLLVVCEDAGELLDRLFEFKPPQTPQWIDLEET